MQEHDVLNLIKQADRAISAEDFDALMEFYSDDAVLVVQPGQGRSRQDTDQKRI